MCDHAAFVKAFELDLRDLSKVLVSDTRAFIAELCPSTLKLSQKLRWGPVGTPGGVRSELLQDHPSLHTSQSLRVLGLERAVGTATVGTPRKRRSHVC